MPKPPARVDWTPDDDIIAPYVDHLGLLVQSAWRVSGIARWFCDHKKNFERAPDERATAYYAEQFPAWVETINNSFARHCIACAERSATEYEVKQFAVKLVACFPSSEAKSLGPYSLMLIEQLERLMPSAYALRRALLFFATREKSEWLPTVAKVVTKVSDEQRKVESAIEALREADADILRLEALPAFGDVPMLEHNEQIPINIVGVGKTEKEAVHR